MADNKEEILLNLKIQTDKANNALKKTDVAIKKTIQSFRKLKKGSIEYQDAQAKLASLQVNYTQQTLKYNKALQAQIGDKKQGLNGVTKATGGATAAAMELGRVVSDAPYGIRGMANNISQLASQLFYMAGQQVTATTATNTDTVAKGANTTATVAATGATIGLSGALRMMWSALMGPMGVLLGIQAVISAFDFFYGANKKAEDSVGDLNKAIGGTAGANTKLLAYSEIIKTSSKDTKEYKNALKELKSKGYDPASESLDNFINKQLKLLVIRAKSKVIEDELNKLFTEQVTKESKLREQQQRIDALEIKKEKEKSKVKRDRIQNNIDYIESQKEVVVVDEKYKKLQKELIDLTSEEFKLIDNITKKSKDTGDVFKGKFIESYYNEIAGLEEIIKDEDFDGISDSAKITGTIILKPKIDNPDPEEIDKISEFISNYKTLMSGLTDFIDGEFERELTIEQNRTNVLNKQLNDRLLNESLSADQRKSIQNEIAQNDENLRIKQDAIAKKKFKTAKAFAISMAVADTYLAGVKVLADPSFVGRPFARGIAMAATIASGLASVAAISRQKFQSSSAATPVNVGGGGGASGASERSEPSFNIVGRSGENLLINAIQAQFGKPLKAYVVSRDVTTQQQLDGMIVGQAGT
jgi:hypothetical protein